MTRKFLANLLVLSGGFAFGQAGAQDNQYLDGVRSDYAIIFVLNVDEGNSVRTTSGNFCFYKYETEIRSTIRGRYEGTRFTFFSESKLTIGSDYLTYFSRDDAAKYRVLQSYIGTQADPACRKLMTGFLLLDTETHRIRDAWDGKELRSFVEFSDPSADLIRDHEIAKTTRLFSFDYVKAELAK
jgi:hypothetical protein